MKDPWETLGVEKTASEEEIRKAFRTKARKLHPDKGGSASEFRELYDAYNILKDSSYHSDDDTEWVGWLGRWAKRFIGTDDKILKIKVPYKLLEDREQTIQLEYDGIPVVMDLRQTEKITFGGMRIRLIPNAYILKNKEDIEKEDAGVSLKEEPWLRDTEWMFVVPRDTMYFKIKGGEWCDTPGEYVDGVFWVRSNE
jgi:hypothetical protein